MPVQREMAAPTTAQAGLRSAFALPWKLRMMGEPLLPEPEVAGADTTVTTAAIMVRQTHGLIAAMAAFGAGSRSALDSERQTILPVYRPEPMWVAPSLM